MSARNQLWTIVLLLSIAGVQSFTFAPKSIRSAARAGHVRCSAVQHSRSEDGRLPDRRFDITRRGLVAGILISLASPVLAEDVLRIPESERIKPPADSCAQGAGGKCDELSEGNAFIKELQARSAKNRIKYQKEELESYWQRNYKDFFDYACTAYDKKCDFKQNADGTWTVGTKESGFKLKEAKNVKLLDTQ